jgi:hypothetical protein
MSGSRGLIRPGSVLGAPWGSPEWARRIAIVWQPGAVFIKGEAGRVSAVAFVMAFLVLFLCSSWCSSFVVVFFFLGVFDRRIGERHRGAPKARAEQARAVRSGVASLEVRMKIPSGSVIP